LRKLFTEFNLKNIRIKNRIGVPPMAAGLTESGTVTPKNIEHYSKLAKGGAGLIIQEATCININARFSENQLGIWTDDQIEGLRQIVDAVHRENCNIFIQLQHSGLTGISEPHLSPSPFQHEAFGRVYEAKYEMSVETIQSIQHDFIQAAIRAYQAGYDGVELHGSRSFLICQFFNRFVNQRTDKYGTAPETFVTEIMDGIRQKTPGGFIVGIRLGGFEPQIDDAIRHAMVLEQHGVDFIDIGDGFFGAQGARAEADYPYSHTVHAAQLIKEQVSVPVFAVGEIKTPELAEEILNTTNVDLVHIGRGFLANPNWANDARGNDVC